MANFTMKHYQTVADVLRTNLNKYEIDLLGTVNDDDTIDDIYATASARVAIKDIARDLHNIFRSDNPRYDADKFWEACGIDDWRDMTQVEEWDLRPYKAKHDDGTWYGTKHFPDHDNGRIED